MTEFTSESAGRLFDLIVCGKIAQMFMDREVEPTYDEWPKITGESAITLRDIGEIAHRLGFDPVMDFIGGEMPEQAEGATIAAPADDMGKRKAIRVAQVDLTRYAKAPYDPERKSITTGYGFPLRVSAWPIWDGVTDEQSVRETDLAKTSGVHMTSKGLRKAAKKLRKNLARMERQP